MGKSEPLRVSFELDPHDWHGAGSEGIWVLWVAPASDNRAIAEVNNIPFYSRAVSLGDKVILAHRNNQVVVDGIAERGGHSTYRIVFENPDGDKTANGRRILSSLEQLGCHWESAAHNPQKLYAIDVPPETDAGEVYDILEKAEKAGVLTFEEGYFGHPRKRDEKPSGM